MYVKAYVKNMLVIYVKSSKVSVERPKKWKDTKSEDKIMKKRG